MSNWNDNRSSGRSGSSAGSLFKSKAGRRQPGVVVNNSPEEPPLPVTIQQLRALDVHVNSDSSKVFHDNAWLIALGVAIVGLLLIILFVGPTVNQQIFWVLALLTLVIAIKR